jgi:deoxyribodipyrimidine photolyase
VKIFLINNNLRYKNNFILEEAFKYGGLIIYINPYMSWMEKNKYIWESYNLLDLQKKLPVKILYFFLWDREIINFLINLEEDFQIYGDVYFIRELKKIINIYKQEKNENSNKFHEDFQKLNIEYHVVKSNTLLIPTSYKKEYKVYTAFKNNFINNIGKFKIIEDYDFSQLKNNNYEEYYVENKLKELKDLPPYKFSEDFPIGEEAAYKRWEDFKDSIKDYEVNRNIPYLNNTSKLSPYINSGIISVEIIWNELLKMDPAPTLVFKQELLWREFAYHTYYYNPSMVSHSINEKFEKIPWKYKEDNPPYDKWEKGETGFMMVDGGMRELNTTGYMFNRCRMIVASFLIKNLKVHWYVGANYFMRHLLDGDYVINAFNWQWVNGSGRDAAPYFRIFNPILQLEKFDKDLKYVGKYLNLKTYEKDYPPIIDFQKSREEILALYKKYIKDMGNI